MRVSCNGCRVLRKGCSDDCSIRPCLQWINNPESQANATVFLAKFYGRAGLMNLINAGPDHLRPAIFRSLLYEACGRIVNPIYGSVGLLWSGKWPLCQAAVEAVLKGAPIVQIPSEKVASTPVPPLEAYDTRHVATTSAELHKISKSRTRFKRPGSKPRPAECDGAGNLSWPRCSAAADLSHEPEANAAAAAAGDGDSRDNESIFSAEAASHVSQGEESRPAEEGEVGLELTLGFEPASGTGQAARPAENSRCDVSRLEAVDLCLELQVA
ncbi:LOB domain-containing protein 40-like [Canna indica]|uniref:LOB domain-containing protein 40-like n=1 Tax=Canna indica TaxID=4628 RepID=A0AAQ3KRE7_9LILI|nr:LOB domain-containing protein 40-like [Canna indica]